MTVIEAILHRMHRYGPLSACAAAALCLMLAGSGCAHKLAKTTPPVLVPSIESAPEPEPPPQTVVAPEAEPQPEPTPATTIAPPQEKPRPKPRKPLIHKPPAVVETPKPEPSKPAAQLEPSHPAENSVQITAAVPASAVQSQKQNTEQLLRTSQAKLEGVNRSLNDSERAMANQAREYIAQSNQAMQQGEIERAYNLAIKASLLADELAK